MLSAMWRVRVLELGVVIAAVLSAGLLAAMLAAPFLPQPSTVASLSSATPASSASATPAAETPPIGLYQMRNAFSFGPCLALELEAQSYPVAEGTEGSATVLWWVRGMTGCDSRTGEVQTITARTHLVPDADDPAAPPVGYTLEFSLPAVDAFGPTGEAPMISASLTILARQSTDTLLQAIEDAPGSGQGYVLDRVPAVDPRLDPLPTATPVAAGAGPTGLYLLRGPIVAAGPCLAIELTQESYTVDSSSQGSATIRWWRPGGSDPDDPAMCLSRVGEMQEAAGAVALVTDSGGGPVGYAVRFALPLDGGEASSVEIAIDAAASNRDQLRATLVSPDAATELMFDRVDELNPPPAP